MRKVLRNHAPLSYWNKRWSDFDSDQDAFINMNIYPVKYVNRIMKNKTYTLEAGCGLGRVIKHYHNLGFNIIGFDFSEIAVKKLNETRPELNVSIGDITNMKFDDETFDNILALGVYHSIEDLGLIDKGIKEVYRCLKKGGYHIASVRADNLENRIIDYITEKRGAKGFSFHKWCFKASEFRYMLTSNNFEIEKEELVTNVPFLHKFRFFRKNESSNEKELRSEGFKLNFLGKCIYWLCKTIAPGSFGTTIVFTVRKK